MGTEILKTFSHLQNELEEAKNSLKGVDANIKRLIGRDPSELQRPGTKRPLDEKNARQPFSKFGRFENNELPKPRNRSAVSVFKRLSEKVPDEPIAPPSKGLISKVIAAPKEVPSRQEMLDKQSKDTKYKERNRRMFGALLGTLQKFQQDECKLKKKVFVMFSTGCLLVSPKLVRVEQWGLGESVLYFCERKYKAVLPSTAAFCCVFVRHRVIFKICQFGTSLIFSLFISDAETVQMPFHRKFNI